MTLERAIAAVGEPADLEPPVLEAPTPAPDSLIAKLRTRAAQLRNERTTDIAIPGYENLWARYHAINAPRVFAGPNGMPRNVMGDWRVAADALGTALEGLYGRDTPDDPLTQLLVDGQPARYDDDLVAALDLHVTEHTARGVMCALFGGDEKGESRVWAHFLTYQNWLMAGEEGPPEVAETLGEYRRS